MSNFLQGGMLVAAALDGFDMTRKMPILSIVCIGISLFVTVGVPVTFLLLMRKRIRFSMRAVLIGMASYILSLMLLYNVSAIGILSIPGARTFFENSRAMSSLLANVLTMVLGFLGVFLGIKFLGRKKLIFDDVVMFLFGFAAVVLIVSSAANLFGLLTNALMINSQGLQAIFDQIAEGELSQAAKAYDEILTQNPLVFLVEGMSSILTFTFRLLECLMIYGFLSHKCTKKTLLYAFAGEFLFAFPVFLYDTSILNSRWLVILLMVVVVAAMGYYGWKLFKGELSGEWEYLNTKKIKKQAPPKKMPKITMPKD